MQNYYCINLATDIKMRVGSNLSNRYEATTNCAFHKSDTNAFETTTMTAFLCYLYRSSPCIFHPKVTTHLQVVQWDRTNFYFIPRNQWKIFPLFTSERVLFRSQKHLQNRLYKEKPRLWKRKNTYQHTCSTVCSKGEETWRCYSKLPRKVEEEAKSYVHLYKSEEKAI